jgi:apolipoprotein N-acyltransferase
VTAVASPRDDAGSVRWALAIVAALLNAVSLSWPFESPLAPGEPVWYFSILGHAMLVRALLSCGSAAATARTAMLYATVWLSLSFWWLYVALHVYGDLPAVLAALAVVALAAGLSIYYAAAGWALWQCRGASPLLAGAAFAALWTMAEMARGTWLTGFGWGAPGYSHVEGPLAAWAPLLGVYGVGALAAWAAFALARPRKLAPASVVLLTVLMLPAILPLSWRDWTRSSGQISVTLLQGNIAQEEKFVSETGVRQALQWYGERVQRPHSDLVVAPETAFVLLPQELPVQYWDSLRAVYAQNGGAALIGMPMGNRQQGYTNAILGLGGQVAGDWRYAKHHLVPFGEFIPAGFRWFTDMLKIPQGDFARGMDAQPQFFHRGQRIAANICYEDLFGEEIALPFREAQSAPTLMLNVSNMGWYGASLAMEQHLQISRMRSLEFQRSYVSVANTGITATIDHHGVVTARLPRDQAATLDATVEGRIGSTPYAWWVSRAGLWPLWLLAILAWLLARRYSANSGGSGTAP